MSSFPIRITGKGNRKVVEFADYTDFWLHKAVIVQVFNDGRIVLDSGGWLTKVTKAAMNQVLNESCNSRYAVSMDKGVWIITNNLSLESIPFTDNIILN